MRPGAKLLIVAALVAAGGALALVGAAPEGYAATSAIVEDPAAFEGTEVEVKAAVVEGSLQRGALPVTFLLDDGRAVLPVRWDPARPLPDEETGGTIEGKNVVVRGTVLLDERGAPYLMAHGMQVGCVSKYQAA